MDLYVQPDFEAAAREYLRAVSQITDLVGNRIHPQVPSTAVFPLVTLARVASSSFAHGRFEGCTVQVSAWAQSKVAAFNLGSTLLAAMAECTGIYKDAFISGATIESGLIYSPDETATPALERYVFTAVVYGHRA